MSGGSVSIGVLSIVSNEDLRLLGVREVAGRVEAILSWVPDAAFRREADGAELHLSSHVLDAGDGHVIIFDGPRAVPCRGREGRLAVLPLEIPLPPGRYRVQIEPVVESRFWASNRGFVPLELAAERRPDGSILFLDAATDRQYILSKPVARDFSIETPLYGLDDSERCIEIPWVLSRYRGESRVLDLGYANAEPRYLQARDALKIPLLVGLDLAAVPQSGIYPVAGDALAFPFRPETFDLVLAISAIGRIGRDNSRYSDGHHREREFGDLEAATGLVSLLRPGGRLLITVPFGRLEDHGWFVQYDLRRIHALVKSTACELTLADYYSDGPEGWTGPWDPAALGQVEYRTGFAARAVACLELTRVNKPGSNYSSRFDPDLIPEAAAGNLVTLPAALSPGTRRILKLSGAWSKMRGETGRMRPIMLFCETVNICNADCVFCPYSAQTRPRGFMTSDLFAKVLAQYREIGGGRLTLTPMVGDALLDRLWMERVRLLAKAREQVTPSITTNLYALDQYSDQEILEMLRGFSRIYVSCYGITADECETITRRRSFDRFLTQMRRLLSLRRASATDCEIRIGIRTLTPRTSNELTAFLREQVGEVLPFRATHTYKNWGNTMRGPLPGEAVWAPERTNESPCIMLPLAMQIYWDGRVSACSCCDYDSSSQLFLGDLTQQSLSEIFNSPSSQELWRLHETGCLPPICRNCTFHVPLANLHPKHPIIQNPLGFIGA
jgi:O-antigen chain-terminating methyltransferase